MKQAEKIILFKDEARKKLASGVSQLNDAVSVTLGPMGRHVIIDTKFNEPQVTKDGVTVAKNIVFPDRIEEMGASLIKSAAIKTDDNAGDGTTTATILTNRILSLGMKYVDEQKTNSVALYRALKKYGDKVIDQLKDIAIDIDPEDYDKMRKVAIISSNRDMEITDTIMGAIEGTGNDGVITLEESATDECYIEITDGMHFPQGYEAVHFSNTMHRTFESKEPFILIINERLSDFNTFVSLVENNLTDKEVLIVAQDVSPQIMTFLVQNAHQGNFRCCYVKAPYQGKRRDEYMEDLALYTGGEIVDKAMGLALDGITLLSQFGRADEVKVDANSTTILGGGFDELILEDRVAGLLQQAEDTISDATRDMLRNRVGQLKEGVAKIFVGAPSEVAQKEKQDRFNDALRATHAVTDHGYLPGGGVALLRALKRVLQDIGLRYGPENDDGSCEIFFEKGKISDIDQKALSILLTASKEPLIRMLLNAGYDEKDIKTIFAKVEAGKVDLYGIHPSRRKNKEPDVECRDENFFGFDVERGEFCDMEERGIIDAALVTISAWRSAVDTAGMLMTTECAISIEIDGQAR